ncbi:NAD(P) transhydrogenase subunit alpha [Devosia sp. WQ 349]|uniref:NAD(P) transhydrogenase subunit alpha n=1 Tax=Devosia sp. WQ 349K1 TaxID=2800329 RepID=UPI0019072DF9|nr:NAD(P) transhydrogenase subunit alpha [Devosia sp. WQ 349K1]MBK1794098.1 NAD(P) transhydrogenase subunit alpha [Devosia sp. WQ 349K1]
MGQNTHKAVIAVLAETLPGERRVALVPADIGKLAQYDIVVEAGAGLNAGFVDEDYSAAGGKILARAEAIAAADLVLAVRAPDFAGFAPGKVVISLGGRDAAVADAAAKAQILHLGMERLPRITRAQSMDVLSSQASIAGYSAVLEGARHLDTLLPMMTTAAGIVRPAKMIALGAGVAGLQALATARRLGAVTYGFDVREAAREQVESLGAEFVFPDVPDAKAEGTGGYAAAQSDDQQFRLRRALTEALSRTNLIITSAQIPGRVAPILIDEETIAAMLPGTVIIDMAAETGGNVTITKPDQIVRHGRVTVIGPTNLPSAAPTDSSRLYSGNMRTLLTHLCKAGPLNLQAGDEILDALAGDQALPARAAA